MPGDERCHLPFKIPRITIRVYDKNKFSDIDNDDNYGYARNLKIDFKPQALNLFSAEMGKVGFLYRDRYVENTFSSLDRINAIEFNRDYNVSASKGGVIDVWYTGDGGSTIGWGWGGEMGSRPWP